MCIRGLALLYLLWGLPAIAQQNPPADSHPAVESNSAARTPTHPAEASSSPADATAKAPDAPKLDLTPDANGRLTQEQMRELTRVVAQNYRDNFKRERDYTFIERDVENNEDGKGQTKSTEVETYEVMAIYGQQVRRLIEKNDKPLDSKEAAKQEKKIQKIIDERKNESDEDRRKREEKEAKEREDSRKFVSEVADSYEFKLVGTELVGGREAWVIDGEPRPELEPHQKDAKFLSKFHGRLWIDKSDMQLAKMDVEAIDTVSVGWVLARIHKGTRFMFERTRMNDEIWLPKRLTYKFDARVALFKGYNIDAEQTYRDYKKFRTSARIVGMGEVQDPKPDRKDLPTQHPAQN